MDYFVFKGLIYTFVILKIALNFKQYMSDKQTPKKATPEKPYKTKGGYRGLTAADNINGFQKNPQNINRKGRPVSVKTAIKEILAKSGELTIDKRQIVRHNKNGSVTVKLATDLSLAIRLSGIALGKSALNSLKAIQMILEHTDGRPIQTIDATITPQSGGATKFLLESEEAEFMEIKEKE